MFGPVTLGANRVLARAGLRKEFLDNYSRWPMEAKFFVKTGTTNENEIQMTKIVGPNRLFQSGEMAPTPMMRIEVADKNIAVSFEFKGGYAVSERAQRKDLYGKLNQGAKHLAHAARMTEEFRAASLLNDFFTGAIYRGSDNLSFGNAAHVLMRGTNTYRNIPQTPVGFSFAGVTTLLELADNCVDENGDPIVVNIDRAIIPNTQAAQQLAIKIFEQDMEPETANNDVNTIKKQKKITAMVSHYMQSKAHYFMFDSRMNDFNMLHGRPFTLFEEPDKERTLEIRGVMELFVFGYDYRAWFGANPT